MTDPKLWPTTTTLSRDANVSDCSAFTDAGIDYAVETDKYVGGVLFRSERVGAFFYVLPEAAAQARDIMRQHGFRFHDLLEGKPQ